MKNTRLFLSAFVVFAIVGSALAYNSKPMGSGSVYCIDNGNTCADRRDFRPDENGDVTDVCNGQEFISTGTNCIVATGPFLETAE